MVKYWYDGLRIHERLWNMIYKPRTESNELLMLKFLNSRMTLSERDKQHYLNLKKGFEGEVQFDLLTEKLQCECLILNDLLLKFKNTTFQIDSLIIVPETIYFFEVKNLEGDYFYEQERLYLKPKSEMNNPLIQLNRSESLLRQLLHSLGFKISITASVVFINPEFTLYQAPLDKPFIFPTQVNRYLEKFNTIPSKLNGKHKILADKLVSLHMEDSPFKQIPAYNYGHLRKGFTCEKCTSFSIYVEGKKSICKDCGHVEILEDAVMRSVRELKLLFPNQKITTNVIHEWCGMVVSKRIIKYILDKNYKLIGIHQWAYFE
jgi:hypothetical protein